VSDLQRDIQAGGGVDVVGTRANIRLVLVVLCKGCVWCGGFFFGAQEKKKTEKTKLRCIKKTTTIKNTRRSERTGGQWGSILAHPSRFDHKHAEPGSKD